MSILIESCKIDDNHCILLLNPSLYFPLVFSDYLFISCCFWLSCPLKSSEWSDHRPSHAFSLFRSLQDCVATLPTWLVASLACFHFPWSIFTKYTADSIIMYLYWIITHSEICWLKGHKIFLFGGYDGKGRTNELYILDTAEASLRSMSTHEQIVCRIIIDRRSLLGDQSDIQHYYIYWTHLICFGFVRDGSARTWCESHVSSLARPNGSDRRGQQNLLIHHQDGSDIQPPS